MKVSGLIVKLMVCVFVLVCAAGSEPVVRADANNLQEESVFMPVGVYIDTGSRELGVYQVQITVKKGDAKIVGVEGGEHTAFEKAPYYDPAALAGGKIILATFSTKSQLPKGRTRVATMHMMVTGDVMPEYEVVVDVVGDGEGKSVAAVVTVE